MSSAWKTPKLSVEWDCQWRSTNFRLSAIFHPSPSVLGQEEIIFLLPFFPSSKAAEARQKGCESATRPMSANRNKNQTNWPIFLPWRRHPRAPNELYPTRYWWNKDNDCLHFILFRTRKWALLRLYIGYIKKRNFSAMNWQCCFL